MLSAHGSSVNILMMKRYKIGEIAKLSGLTLRTIRYYGELGLLSEGRTGGNQRYYSDQDLVYLKRIQSMERMSVIQSHIDELKWHIDQLESAEDGFTECPGSACAGCEHKTKCVFFKQI